MSKLGSFIKGRINGFKYAGKGAWILVATEHSIIAQVIIAIIVTILGFLLNISTIEWMFQILAIGLILVAESLNTAIEKIADFIHPDRHPKIGELKDISAGAAFFAATAAIIIGLIIYVPKILYLINTL